MNRRLFKSIVAAGAVAMICACGDDSGSGNDTPTTNSADSGLPVTNPCAGYTVFHAGWIVELAPGDYWVVDKETSTSGQGVVYDKTGNVVPGNFFALDLVAEGYDFEYLLLTTDGLFFPYGFDLDSRCGIAFKKKDGNYSPDVLGPDDKTKRH